MHDAVFLSSDCKMDVGNGVGREAGEVGLIVDEACEQFEC